MDWYAETWFLSSKLSPSREGGKTFPWHVPVAWPSVAVRGVRMAHAKKQRRKENREPVCVMLSAEHLFRNSHSHPSGKRSDRGMRLANTHRLRPVNRLSSTRMMLLLAERWVSRSVVNRADARGGIWDVEVVQEIICRPLHHTLLIVESQQAVSSVV